MWELLDADTDTRSTEIPGVGCIVATPGVGMCFVPSTRLRMLDKPMNGATHVITRDERTAPPITSGLSAAEIRAKQAAVVDPGAQQYIIHDTDDMDYG